MIELSKEEFFKMSNFVRLVKELRQSVEYNQDDDYVQFLANRLKNEIEEVEKILGIEGVTICA